MTVSALIPVHPLNIGLAVLPTVLKDTGKARFLMPVHPSNAPSPSIGDPLISSEVIPVHPEKAYLPMPARLEGMERAPLMPVHPANM